MRQEFKHKIGSNLYSFKQLRLTPARELMETLGKMGESISEPLSKPGVSMDDVAPGVLSGTVAALVRSFGSEAGAKALDILFAESTVHRPESQAPIGLAGVAEDHFGEHFGDLFPFLVFALKSQFGPFVHQLGALIPNAAKLQHLLGMSAFLGKSASSTASEGTS